MNLPRTFKYTPGAIQKRMRHLARLVPKEKRQKVLDLAHASHNIGVISEVTGLESSVVCEILRQNMEDHSFKSLRKTDL